MRHKTQWSPDALGALLGQVRKVDRSVGIEWGRDAGEHWATLKKNHAVLGFLHDQLPIGIFIEGVDDVLVGWMEESSGLVSVRAPSYDEPVFRVQADVMSTAFPDVALSDDWNPSSFSVWDLWYQTVT